MEDFKGKEIECQKCTYGQDGALQENTVQSNFKKPRCVQALGATKHGTILSFFQKATPPPPKQISTADPSTCCNTDP